MAMKSLTSIEEGFLHDLLSSELEPLPLSPIAQPNTSAKSSRIVQRLRNALSGVVDTRKLALEVASATESAEEFQSRIDRYLLEGTGVVFAIYPTLECILAYEGTKVRRLSKKDSIEAPGRSVALSEIFSD